MKGIISLMVLMGVFVLMFAGQHIYDDRINETDFNIYNYTEQMLVWNYSANSDTIQQNFTDMTKFDYGKIKSQRLSNSFDKIVDCIGYVTFEIGKIAIEFGYEHPEYNYEYIFKLLKFTIYFIIFCALFPLIVPILAISYLFYIGIKNLIEKIKVYKNNNKGE